jgi:hypothetical protein
MPYRDPERRRAYQAEYRRLKRAGRLETPARVELPAQFRLQTARDVLALLEEQINSVRWDPAVSTLERARCIGSLAGVALRAVEAGQLEERLAALEAVLGSRERPQ